MVFSKSNNQENHGARDRGPVPFIILHKRKARAVFWV